MTTTNPLKFMRIRSHQIFVPNRWPGDYQEKEDFLRELVANMLPKCHADSPHGERLKRNFEKKNSSTFSRKNSCRL